MNQNERILAGLITELKERVLFLGGHGATMKGWAMSHPMTSTQEDILK